MLTGGAVLLVAGLLRGEALPHSASVESLLALAYLVVFGSLVAFSAYIYLLRATTPALAMSYAYVNPVLAVLMGTLFAQEALGASTLAAGALVLLGVVVLVTRPRGTTA